MDVAKSQNPPSSKEGLATAGRVTCKPEKAASKGTQSQNEPRRRVIVITQTSTRVSVVAGDEETVCCRRGVVRWEQRMELGTTNDSVESPLIL